MKIETRWCCGECGELYEEEDRAVDCCRPPPPYQVYVCPECQDEHRTELQAIGCCATEPPPSAAELEAAGQQRLIP